MREELLFELWRQRNKLGWRAVFKRLPYPNAKQLQDTALEECERDLAEHEHAAEFHQGMADMLKKRRARLSDAKQGDVVQLRKPKA